MSPLSPNTKKLEKRLSRKRSSAWRQGAPPENRIRPGPGETAKKLFELSQSLKDKWFAAETPEKRAILEIACLNLVFKNASLDITMSKPFDMFAEGLQIEKWYRRVELKETHCWIMTCNIPDGRNQTPDKNIHIPVIAKRLHQPIFLTIGQIPTCA